MAERVSRELAGETLDARVAAVLDRVDDPCGFAADLYAFADVVRANPKLAEALSDPGRDPEERRALARRLLGGKSEELSEVIEELVGQRRLDPADLAGIVDNVGLSALAAGASRTGSSVRLQDELFSIEETLRVHRDLRLALSDDKRAGADKAALAEQIFAPHVSPEALLIVRRVVADPSGRPLQRLLLDARVSIAAAQGREVATVRAATRPSEDQLERLKRILSSRLGREVILNVALDPDLIGGMRVSVGDTIYDGSLKAALHQAERTIAGAHAPVKAS